MKILLLSILLVAMIGVMVPSAFSLSSSELNQIQTDYRLKGDAYDELGHSYMAFLNYDKANWQSGKNTNYNEWAEYKKYVDENEQFFGGTYSSIIIRALSIGDYEGVILYTKLAEKNFPDDGIRTERLIAYSFLDRQTEYDKLVEEIKKTNQISSDFAEGSWADVYGDMMTYYANEQYTKVIDAYDVWVISDVKAHLDLQGISANNDMSLIVGMAYEKLGKSNDANYFYDQVSYLEYWELDCLKVSRYYDMRLYQTAVDIFEKSKNTFNCPVSIKHNYLIAKDLVSGQWIPPIQRISLESPLSEKSIGIPEPEDICGKGTVMKDGQCILDEREGGGCLIATAAFGSELAPQVQFLREIRDGTVMSTQSGTTFMNTFNQFYYSFSPQIADYERENPVFKEAVKVTLTPLLTSLTLLNYVDLDTEEEMLGYGISIILLNIGMYFVLPAAIILQVKRWKSKN